MEGLLSKSFCNTDLTVHCVTAVLERAQLCQRRNYKKVLRLEWTPVSTCILVTAEHDDFFCCVFFFFLFTNAWTPNMAQAGWESNGIRALLPLAEAHSSTKKKKSTMKWTNMRPSCYWDFWSYDNSYYNLSQDMNYFVLVPGVINKTLVEGRSCNTIQISIQNVTEIHFNIKNNLFPTSHGLQVPPFL